MIEFLQENGFFPSEGRGVEIYARQDIDGHRILEFFVDDDGLQCLRRLTGNRLLLWEVEFDAETPWPVMQATITGAIACKE